MLHCTCVPLSCNRKGLWRSQGGGRPFRTVLLACDSKLQPVCKHLVWMTQQSQRPAAWTQWTCLCQLDNVSKDDSEDPETATAAGFDFAVVSEPQSAPALDNHPPTVQPQEQCQVRKHEDAKGLLQGLTRKELSNSVYQSHQCGGVSFDCLQKLRSRTGTNTGTKWANIPLVGKGFSRGFFFCGESDRTLEKNKHATTTVVTILVKMSMSCRRL